ncbi:MAG: hypothetical protein ACOC7V_13875 [Spirochaetota bacterium]
MTSQPQEIANGLIIVHRNGNDFLGVDTGIPSNSPSLRKLAGQKRQHGWLIRGDSAEIWQPLGFVEHAGSIHVYGPLAAGRFVEEILHDESIDRLGMLERLARALAVLRAQAIEMVTFHSRSLVVLDDGAVLVLPPDIMTAIREHQDYVSRIHRMERYNHPDRSPEENVGFSLAAATYFVLTGAFPYDADDEEELHARVRAGAVVPAHYRDPTIREDVSSALQAELTAKETAVEASDWAERLHDWNTRGARRELSDSERSRIEQEASQAIERLERTFKRKESVRRNGRKALIIAAIVIVVGTIPGTIIRNALQPRATAGLPAEEVVSVFYTSINSLDHMTMEDAVVDNAGRDLVREVTNLFVIDRQRMSVEMESGFVDAQQWRDTGMPTLAPNKSPYGVANLELVDRPSPEGERRFEARYERWLPDYELAETTGRAGISGFAVVDRVSMRMDGEDWVIYEIERIEQEPIDVDELRADEDDAA